MQLQLISDSMVVYEQKKGEDDKPQRLVQVESESDKREIAQLKADLVNAKRDVERAKFNAEQQQLGDEMSLQQQQQQQLFAMNS
jgi:hypothetical protein